MAGQATGILTLVASLEAEGTAGPQGATDTPAESHDGPQGAARRPAAAAGPGIAANAWGKGGRAEKVAKQRRAPPESAIKKISMPTTSYDKALLDQSIKVTLTSFRDAQPSRESVSNY